MRRKRVESVIVAYSEGGKRVESECGDWCCMYKIIEDYKETGLSESEAYEKFWKDIKMFDEDSYNLIVAQYNNRDEAISDGAFDELRIEYLESKGLFELTHEE